MKAPARSRKSAETDSRPTIKKVRAIYDTLANRPVERDCTRLSQCCHFVLTGRTPFLTRGEALVAAAALRATGRKRLPESGACPFFSVNDRKCMIYADRPFGCRTHFCRPAGGPYARGEVLDLIRDLEKIDADLGGTAAHPLREAVESCL
ncbi:MAG: YkgJ family cysteine cluster protein [Verrucomicrobiota bacterium]|nr:YkgJ family cysteine cluster protein [Verrucomicrobiota bacterium]